jgi:hypothetical protein
MTFELIKTDMKGFPIQYGESVVRHLNEVCNKRSFNEFGLGEIGAEVSLNVKCGKYSKRNDVTKDDYFWFGSLDFPLNNAHVVILFPWAQDFENPISKLDRSINVYSDKRVSDEEIGNLLEQVAYQMSLTN